MLFGAGVIDCPGIRLPFYYKPENRAAKNTTGKKNRKEHIEPPHFCSLLRFFFYFLQRLPVFGPR